MKTIEQLKKQIAELHTAENSYNKENNKCDKQIFMILKRKKKLAKMISHNMKFRNKIINQLHQLKNNS